MDSLEIEIKLAQEEARFRILEERVQIAIRLVLVSCAIFAVADLALVPQEVLPAIWACKLVQVGVVIWVWYRLKQPVAPRTLQRLALLSLATVVLMTVASGYLLREPHTSPVLSVAILLAAAGLFPWDVRYQLGLVAVTASATTALHASLGSSPAHGDVAIAAVAFCSVLMTGLLLRRRFDDDARERSGRLRELRERRLVDKTLAANSRLVRGLGEPDLLAFFCEVIRESVRADWSVATERRPTSSGEALVAVAAAGIPQEQWSPIEGVPFDRSLGGDRLPEFRDDVAELTLNEAEIAGALGTSGSGSSGPSKSLSGLLVRTGDSNPRVLLTAWRSSAENAFSDEEARLLRIIRPVFTAVLEQRRLLQQLREAKQAESRFLANMSHELRTPLNIILGYIEILLDDASEIDSTERNDLLRRVDANARRQAMLVGEALEISRHDDDGNALVRREKFDLGELVGKAVEDLRFRMKGSAVQSILETPEETILVASDAIKLRMIIDNLLDNARKFTREGHIRVALERSAEQVSISIRDTGPGVPPALAGVMFEPFRRGRTLQGTSEEGIGIGLYLVRRLTALLGGTVHYEPASSGGASFTIELPTDLPGDG